MYRDFVDMIDGKWLVDLVFTTVHTGVDLSKVKSSSGDFQTGSLSDAMNTNITNELTVRSWLEKAGERKSTLVFGIDKAHVKDLTNAFRMHGIDARYVTSDTKKDAREELLVAFKSGVFPVLVNCGIFTEGTDIPNIDCVVLARPTKSRSLLVQMIGRGLRLHTNKQSCHVLDLVSSLKTGIVTTPTLFGLDPDQAVDRADAATLTEMKEQQTKEREEEAAKSPTVSMSDGDVYYTDYASIYDLISDKRPERHIRSMSPFTWLRTDQTRYRLTGRDGSHLTLLLNDGLWSLYHYPRLAKTAFSKSPWARAALKGSKMTLEHATKAAATLIQQEAYKENFPRHFILRNAAWRRQPATQGQVDMLNKIRGEDVDLTVHDITKGEAYDQITKMRSGAKGQFEKAAIGKKSVAKVKQKEEEMARGPWASLWHGPPKKVARKSED
jgi:ATP-dependent helicase IRC3